MWRGGPGQHIPQGVVGATQRRKNLVLKAPMILTRMTRKSLILIARVSDVILILFCFFVVP